MSFLRHRIVLSVAHRAHSTSPISASIWHGTGIGILNVRQYSTKDPSETPIDDSCRPRAIERSNETPDVKRARLLYQSRKRGILETDLLLSTFAAKYLSKMSVAEMDEYDTV